MMSLRDELYVKAKEATQRRREEQEAEFEKRLNDSREALANLEKILITQADKGYFSMGFDEDYLNTLNIPNDVFFHFAKESGFRVEGKQPFGGFKTFTLYWSDNE